MHSKNYERAQSIVLIDKYNMSKNEFNEDLTKLVKRYFEVDGIKAETFYSDNLQIVLTISVKKVKQYKRVLA